MDIEEGIFAAVSNADQELSIYYGADEEELLEKLKEFFSADCGGIKIPKKVKTLDLLRDFLIEQDMGYFDIVEPQ